MSEFVNDVHDALAVIDQVGREIRHIAQGFQIVGNNHLANQLLHFCVVLDHQTDSIRTSVTNEVIRQVHGAADMSSTIVRALLKT